MNHRTVFKGVLQLTSHELEELSRDFGIDMNGYDILAPLTKQEWLNVVTKRKGLTNGIEDLHSHRSR